MNKLLVGNCVISFQVYSDSIDAIENFKHRELNDELPNPTMTLDIKKLLDGQSPSASPALFSTFEIMASLLDTYAIISLLHTSGISRIF